MDSRKKVSLSSPKALQAKVMLWRDVSYHEMEEIEKMQSIPDLESVLCSVFHINLPEPKRGALLDLYVHAVLFCRECSFKREQTSVLLSIIKSIHEANIGTPTDVEECFEYCRELLLCHSIRRPPFSVNLFSREEVTCILKYIHSSYIRHCKLYKCIFSPESETVDQGEPAVEDSSAPAAVTEEAVPEAEEQPVNSSDMQEEPVTEPGGATLGGIINLE
ncbi:cilia- and flagella-associated protein 119 [Aulostomus maculatus]